MKRMKKMMLCILCLLLVLMPLCAGAQTEETQVNIYWTEHLAGVNRVTYPVVNGLSDTAIQNVINQDIFMTLHAGDMLARLERVRQRPEAEQNQRSIYMEGDATLCGQVLSLRVRVLGEQYDGRNGDSVTCLNYNLETGEKITLDAFFKDPQAAKARMTSLVEEQVLPELNAYLENSDVLPLPEDSFFVDEQGIVFYYPQERFSMISGSVGACAFYYYELGDVLTEDALFAPLFASVKDGIADPAAQIREAVQNGEFPQLPFVLGEKVGNYLEVHPLINDPDYTLTSLVYQFEEPVLRGVGVETWVYDEAEEEERAVTAVRSSRIDLYGIQTGVSTLEACISLLGEPTDRMYYDQEQAMDMMLTPGESLLYTFGSNELEVHADEQGVVSCVVIRAGAI